MTRSLRHTSTVADGSPWAPPRGEPSEPEPPRHERHPLRTLRWIVLVVAVVAMVAAVTVVVRQRQRDQALFDEGHAAYVAGDCVMAVDRYDELQSNSRLVSHGDVTDPAQAERAECVELLAVDALAVSDPAAALLGYADVIGRDPGGALVPAVTERVATLVDREGAAAVTSDDVCDRLDELAADGIVPTGSVDEVTLECAVHFDAEGRDDEAYALALDVLDETPDETLARRAVDLALANPVACLEVDRLVSLGGLVDTPDRLASFLQGCMATASARDDTAVLAALQFDFLSLLPDDAGTAGVEAAMLANVDACGLMDEVRADAALATREGFLATFTFGCAQMAEYSGDYGAAIEWYQWFLDHVPLEPRSGVALDGLARSTVALARQRGASELPPPAPTGGSGTAAAEIVLYNDTPDELRVVVSGPESRIVEIPASPTSSYYSMVGPAACRTDVPSVALELTAGTFDVLVETTTADDVDDFLGSWVLDASASYESCFFVVTTFGT